MIGYNCDNFKSHVPQIEEVLLVVNVFYARKGSNTLSQPMMKGSDNDGITKFTCTRSHTLSAIMPKM
jgi:hypothetical protein